MNQVIFDANKFNVNFKTKELLEMEAFNNFLSDYYKEYFPNVNFEKNDLIPDFSSALGFLKDIYNHDEKTLKAIRNSSQAIKDDVLNYIDSLYDYYRRLTRFLVFVKDGKKYISHKDLIADFNALSNSVVTCYREIYEIVLNGEQTVYRVLPSGANAAVLLNKNEINQPKDFEFLKDIPLLEAIVTQPPFIIKTKQNKRVGLFFEQNHYVTSKDFDYKNAYGVLVKIYNTTGLVYFDKKFLGYLVALGNLFQIESYDPNKNNKIDFIVLFGTNNDENQCYYYYKEKMLVGVMPKKANIDYFGYVKKIMLTLFNLKMIEKKLLPIHGAGIKITSKGKTKNFFILGDSGAGKSETIEAIKHLYGSNYRIDTIFDDMGTFHLKDQQVYATGTEIGAFVRLDDLDQGYSLRSIDRAVFFNIDETNSRVVIPIETYEMTYDFHHVDAFLLADNYSDSFQGIKFFNDSKTAKDEFILGKRVALNTTQEKGLVSTYFANPFGPVQKKEVVDTYLNEYFETLFKNSIPVGKIFTRLSLDRKEGPYTGAKALINLFEQLN